MRVPLLLTVTVVEEMEGKPARITWPPVMLIPPLTVTLEVPLKLTAPEFTLTNAVREMVGLVAVKGVAEMVMGEEMVRELPEVVTVLEEMLIELACSVKLDVLVMVAPEREKDEPPNFNDPLFTTVPPVTTKLELTVMVPLLGLK